MQRKPPNEVGQRESARHPEIGRLAQVDLREAWTGEATDFTPWLASTPNISLLGEAIGLDLQVESQETSVGPFRADILCRDTVDHHFVLIENQLERTDHTHLGQLITYAAGLEAVTIVWIAARFTDEHRAALDWLNRATAAGVNFFGLEIGLWRIGDSALAPKFNVVCQPNEWTRSVREQAAAGREQSDKQRLHLEFWTQFREYLAQRHSPVRVGAPAAHYWTNAPVGRTNFVLGAWNGMRDGNSGVQLHLLGVHAKAYFRLIEARYRPEVDRRLGSFGTVEWRILPDRQESQIGIVRPGAPADPSTWEDLDAWMAGTLEAMLACFGPIVKGLRTVDEITAEDTTGEADQAEMVQEGP